MENNKSSYLGQTIQPKKGHQIDVIMDKYR